jgi:glycerol-3-phosphate acyltransferase PlsY
LITQAAGLGDVRKIGSGNIGATNVLRTGRRELAALTLVLDAAKGFAAVMLARYFFPGDAIYIASIAVFLGHCFPVWLGFKGGKGVATYIGILLALAWPVGAVFCAVWLLLAVTQKFSSLAALTASVTAPLFAYAAFLQGWASDGTTLAATVALLAAIVIFNHRANIGRLLNGTEPKIGSEKKTAP